MTEQPIMNEMESPLDLLREWYEWWQSVGPAKMPNSLHVRTALAIALNDHHQYVTCGHEYWDCALDGTTSCRACGVDTTNMEAMGS